MAYSGDISKLATCLSAINAVSLEVNFSSAWEGKAYQKQNELITNLNSSLKELLEQANETQYLTYSPLVWHAPAGAIVAKKDYQIEDLEILNAIKYHTTGKAAMTTLEKIVFLADYIEPGRSQPGVERIRQLATEDLNVAVAQTLSDMVAYLGVKGNGDIHPDTLAAYEYYRQYL